MYLKTQVIDALSKQLSQEDNIDWDTLYREDPAEYVKRKADADKRKEAIQLAQQERCQNLRDRPSVEFSHPGKYQGAVHSIRTKECDVSTLTFGRRPLGLDVGLAPHVAAHEERDDLGPVVRQRRGEADDGVAQPPARGRRRLATWAARSAPHRRLAEACSVAGLQK